MMRLTLGGALGGLWGQISVGKLQIRTGPRAIAGQLVLRAAQFRECD